MPNKNLGKRLLSSKILLLVSLAILIFFSTNLIREIINRRDLQKDVSALEEEINRLEGRNQSLAGLIDYFESLDFVEKEARTKLNLRKPGEKIIIIAEEEASTATSKIFSEDQSNLSISELKPLTNLDRWWNYFFKL